MPLTEKAFAKVSQNYDRLIGGNGVEALRVVTGKPAMRLQHYDKRDLWTIHKFWADNNFPATAGCCNQLSSITDGLVAGHSYTFLDLAELKDKDGNVQHKIAKMRNPWAGEHYHGKWSDHDYKSWTEEWASQVNLERKDDGVFWMPYEDFIRFFYDSEVAYTMDFNFDTKDYKIKERIHRFEIDNPETQYLYLTTGFHSERDYPRNHECEPLYNFLVFFDHEDHKPVSDLTPYQILTRTGFATVGKYAEELPAGKYSLWLINQGNSLNFDMSLNVWASKSQPKIKEQ